MGKRPIVLGIAGGTGSGKTPVAEAIVRRIGPEHIAYIQHDSYYKDQSHLPMAERVRVNYDHPDSLDTELLIRHLQDLLAGHPVEVPIYDFTTYTRTPHTRRVEPKPAILVEGILVFVEKALRELFDIKIYVDADPDIRFIRRLQRDLRERGRTLGSVIQQYLTTVRPMHLEFVEPSKRYADIIIPEGGFHTVASDLIVARINALLREGQEG